MPCLAGENHPQAKLTEVIVQQIRNEYTPGKTTLQQLSTKYSVSRSSIARVISGQTWARVTTTSN